MARLGWFLIALLVLGGSRAWGQSAGSVGEFEWHGFLLGNGSGRTTGRRPGGPEGGDFLLGEERLRLDLTAWADFIEASARVKADLVHDAVAGAFDVDLREAYVAYTVGAFDVRLGRQIVTWGVGDLLFINDVFPKDFVSFFAGRPLEHLKVGVDALRTRYSSSLLNAELVVIPLFEPGNLPTAERFVLFDPFAAVPARQEERPPATFGNTELALRLYRQLGGFDVSVYAYRGFWRTPGLRPDTPAAPTRVTVFFPALSVYGLSAQGHALGGVVSLEAGYYRSRDDEAGDDPAIPNSQVRFLVGYQKQLWPDFTLGMQYYGEVMEDHGTYRRTLPPGFPVQQAYRDLVTLRLTQLLQHQTWTLALFAFASPTDKDFLVQPAVAYKLSDRLSLTVGANLFGGAEETTFFGQFDANDNVYVAVRFDF